MATFTKKRGKANPTVSTASLPDIVFMLLFFFMVVTKLRDSEQIVAVSVPKATELTKLEQKSLVNTILIGKPTERYREIYGTAPRIQLGDKIGTKDDIRLYVESFKTNVDEKLHPLIFTSLKIDKDVKMGIVADVKTELRKAGQLKLNYSALPRS